MGQMTAVLVALALGVLPGTGTRTEQLGNGSVRAFTFTFKAQATAHVKVYVGGVLQVAGFTTTLNANQDVTPGGTVTFTVAPEANALVRVQRETPKTQETVYTPYSAFPAKTTERALDRIVMQAQEADRRVGDAETKHATDKAAQDAWNASFTARENAQDIAWLAFIAGANGSSHAQSDLSSVLAFGSTNPRTLAARFGDIISIRDHGAACDGATDDAAAVNAAIARAAITRAVVLIPGDVKVESTINMASGVRVIATGRILAGTQTTIVAFNAVTDATWEGGEIVGDGATDGQTGVLFTNASRNTLRGVSVTNTLNKGIDLTGTSSDNHLFPGKITGCTGTYGGGLSMYGANVTRNTVHGGYYTGNRAGITLNGGTYNTVIDANASGNGITGLMLDGVDSDTGDGAKYCAILGGTFNDNLDNAAPQHYGGLYLGNGASYNRIIGVTAKGNTSAGIRTSANHGIDGLGNPLVPPLVNNANVGNLIEGATVEGNGAGGIILSGAPKTRIVSPLARANTGHGINLYRSDDVTVEGGESTDNTVAGVYIQAARSRVLGTRIRGNATGYHAAWIGALASDPAWVPTGHVATSMENEGNTVADYNIAAGLGRVENSSGVISDTVYEQGDASYSFDTGTSTVRVIRISVPLTADRTTQLNNIRARAGDTIRVVRTSAATGAYVHTVTAQVFGTLRRLVSPGQWVEATHDGTQWVLSGFGQGTLRTFTLPYSAAIDWDASLSDTFELNPTDVNAYTLNAPTNAAVGQTASFRIFNTRGAPLGVMTWPATFKMTAWVQPVAGSNKTITFSYNGGSWYELSRSTDVPN